MRHWARIEKMSNICTWKKYHSLSETMTAFVIIHLTFTMTCQYFPITVAELNPSNIFLTFSCSNDLNIITLAPNAKGINTEIAIDNALETFWSDVSLES